jgi:serine/threonine-protein kinase
MSEITSRLSTALADRYRLERRLGEGGMATVYLAHDLKHDRKVAVKVLRPELAAILGGERFLNEIKVTAGLQHPHILPLHDSGAADSFLYYVMPYVEGESLREKLDRDKQLDVDEALEIAKGVAAALDYAHEQGIVHRDIKPENILLQRGQPLVADFGIALAVSAAGGTRLTETGLSLGTPHYMSPEQATGDRELDARSDIYSLGAVVYEMLTGEPPHVGKSVQAIIAKILSDTPAPIGRTRELVPPNVDAAVHRALTKSPADRFVSAAQFADALTNPMFTLPRTGVVDARPPGRSIWDRVGPVSLGLAALFLVVALWGLRRPEPVTPVTRVSVRLPPEQGFRGAGAFDVSPDGSVMVFQGPSEQGIWQLWARQWDVLEATPIRNTEAGNFPSISPDAREVAFTFAGSVRVAPIQGGVSRTVADSVRCCVRWSPDGAWIYFDHTAAGIARVPSTGGPIEVITPADTITGTSGYSIFLDVLPGGKGLLFESTTPRGDPRVAALDLETGEITVLIEGQFPRYSNGRVLFASPDGRSLLAATFDAGKLELTGAALPIADGLLNPSGGWSYFAASQTGRLLYSAGSRTPPRYEMVWVTRQGDVISIDPGWTFDPGDNNRALSLSPDGRRLAVTVLEESNYDIWIKELPRGPASRLTFDELRDVRPRWTPDGRSVTFLSEQDGRAGNPAVFLKRAAGTGAAEVVFDHAQPLWEGQFSSDGEWLIARTGGTSTVPGGRDVWAIRPGEDTTAIPLVVTTFDEKAIGLSPDARWLAYESDETGRNEVYVRPFPNVDDGKWQVSTGGGIMPMWARSGRELFYVNTADEMIAARIQPGDAFSVSDRQVLFMISPTLLFRQDEQYSLYDVAPDDQRFVFLRGVDVRIAEPELILVDQWLQTVRGSAGGN